MLSRYSNANQLLLENFRLFASQPALLVKSSGAYRSVTYAQLGDRVLRLASGLIDLGVKPGDRVGILGHNSLPWVVANLGITLAGAIPSALYPTSPPEEMAYILDDLETDHLMVPSPELLEVALGLGRSPLQPAQFLETPLTHLEAVESLAGQLTRESLMTIIYTSGTTGQPKGACLTHGNYLSAVESCYQQIDDADELRVTLSFLPLAHSFERLAGHFLVFFLGRTVALAESLEALPHNFLEVRPQIMTAVPRFFEKLHAGLLARAAALPMGERVLRRSLHLARAARAPGAGPLTKIAALMVDRLLFSRVRARLGGRLKFFISGGAPLRADIIEFFSLLGITILEGWGMTEATAPCTLNTLRAFRPGSVGRPLPGVEIRVAEDGELEVRGPNVFAGYWRLEGETAASMTSDGFYRTGDYGTIDSDGFVWITGRKKHLIILSTGKNVAPVAVEKQLLAGGFIDQAYIHGNQRKYLTALVTVTPERAEGLAAEQVKAAVAAEVKRANSHLPEHMQLKHYRILPRPFSQEEGELTPTLKLRHDVIKDRYKSLLDEMY